MKNLYVETDTPIITALKLMDELKVKLLIVGSQSKFEGLISIGDIQRAIIRNIDLNQPVRLILRTNIIVGNEHESLKEIKQKMLRIRAEFMPVVSSNNEIIKIVFWKDLWKEEKLPPSEFLNLPVVIMAGGKGERLKPITNVLPKPLIPIGEKPIMEHIIENFTDVGCETFYISVNYKAELIEYYFNSFTHPHYNVTFFKEDRPLGTAGSLRLLNGKINTTFFVSNCDIIIDQDYSQIYQYHKSNNNELTLVSALKHYHLPYGILDTEEDGLLQSIKEKPELTFKINAGLYVLEPHLLNEIPQESFFHITDLIQKIKNRKGKVGVFPVSEKSWRDIGEWDEYLKNREE